MHSPTYRIVLAHLISLVEEGLLVHLLLHVAIRVAMHLDAVGRWGHAMVRLEHVFLRLGKYWRACLCEGPHGVVEWRHVVLLAAIVLEVGSLCEIVERTISALTKVPAIVVEVGRQIQVQRVEIDQVVHAAKRGLFWSTLHGIPGLPVHLGEGDGERGRGVDGLAEFWMKFA